MTVEAGIANRAVRREAVQSRYICILKKVNETMTASHPHSVTYV